jgi:hypothetical protein
MSQRSRLCSLVALLVLEIGLAGCSDYSGRYSDGTANGKFIDVKDDSITIGADVDSSFVSNDGTITSRTESPDGKTIVLKGEVDYSGGSGSAFGVTVAPGQERHWKKPFSATINMEEKTIQFQGTLIIDSLDMRTWNVTLKKQ